MKIWLVTIKSGGKTTTLYVQAATKDEAQTKAIGASPSGAEAYVQGTVAKVPEGYTLVTGAGPTPTPTPAPTPAPGTTTGGMGGTTPVPTGQPAAGLNVYVSSQLQDMIMDAVRMAGAWGAGGVYDESGNLTELGQGLINNVLTFMQREGTPATAQQVLWVMQYQDYVAYQKANPFMPVAKDINDYILNFQKWIDNSIYYQQGYSQEQIDSYDRFRAFQSQYGDLNDFMPKDLNEYLANYDKAQQQLTTWTQEAGPEAAGFTDDQVRAFNEYKQYYYQYGKPGEWMPVDVGDFIANQTQAQAQLNVWKQQAAEVEKYELPPEEAARRREESYQEGRYAAQERYGETPMLQETFAAWLPQAAGDMSGALREFVENQYPSLRAQYEAGLPRLTGFPTREEARAEAAKREAGFSAWLTGQTPELEQEYWGQRPYARGEQYSQYSPTLRTVNW